MNLSAANFKFAKRTPTALLRALTSELSCAPHLATSSKSASAAATTRGRYCHEDDLCRDPADEARCRAASACSDGCDADDRRRCYGLRPAARAAGNVPRPRVQNES